MKNGYALPSLRVGLVLVGDTNWDTRGIRAPAATCAAVTDAPEQPAPIMALTPSPSANCVRCKAAVNAS
eukprot:341413-Prymnesium_polylepis.1